MSLRSMKTLRDGPSRRVLGPGEEWLRVALVKMGIVSAHCQIRVTALTGGVSSDIYRVDLPSGVTVCVKRALAKLKVRGGLAGARQPQSMGSRVVASCRSDHAIGGSAGLGRGPRRGLFRHGIFSARPLSDVE